MTLRPTLLSLALLACGPLPEPRGLDVDPSFTTEKHAAIERAVAKWNAVVIPAARIELHDGVIAIHEEPLPDGYVGWSRGNTGSGLRISIKPGLELEVFYRVVLHELGHAMNLHHVEHGVMAPDPAGEFSAEDMAECKRVSACR